MAKRKTNEVTVDGEPLTVDAGYEVGSWGGQTQYKCRQCAFDALDLDKMLEHLTLSHASAGYPVILREPLAPGAEIPAEVSAQSEAQPATDAGTFEVDLEEAQDDDTNTVE